MRLIFGLCFSDEIIVLQLVEVDKEGQVTPPTELLWNTSQGAAYKHLRGAIRNHVQADSTYEFVMAKYQPSSFDWKQIKNISPANKVLVLCVLLAVGLYPMLNPYSKDTEHSSPKLPALHN